MIRLLISCLVFYLTVGASAAQPKLPSSSRLFFNLDSLPVQGVVLNQGWRWHEGDNPNWSNPEIDDQHWQTIDPSQDITEVAKLQQLDRGWLRIHIRVNSALLGNVISMLIEQ